MIKKKILKRKDINRKPLDLYLSYPRGNLKTNQFTELLLRKIVEKDLQ